MKPAKLLIPAIISLALIGAGCSFTQTVEVKEKNTNTENENVNAAPSFEYSGQTDKNALELLQADHEVTVTNQGFVQAIDGVEPGNQEFWAFYVNGESSQVGAKEYVTTDEDRIEWRLEKY